MPMAQLANEGAHASETAVDNQQIGRYPLFVQKTPPADYGFGRDHGDVAPFELHRQRQQKCGIVVNRKDNSGH